MHKVMTFQNIYQVKLPTKKGKEVEVLKADRKLFQRLLVAKDSGRTVDLKQLLESELFPVPQSIATADGKLRASDKSMLAHLLYNEIVTNVLLSTMIKSCCIVDGQAVIQSIGKPSNAKTFNDLARCFFATAVERHIKAGMSRVDVMLNCYDGFSIKDDKRTARTKTKKTIRKIIDDGETHLPSDWSMFISLKDNKANLAQFLAVYLVERSKTANYYVVTAGGISDRINVLISSDISIEGLQSNHEEADTRIIVHAINASRADFDRLLIVSPDTDVLVLLISFREQLCREVWMEIAAGKERKFALYA
jgi:uncharacterized LabA/DUF88 family protein